MNCKNCGARLKDDAVVCPNCGAFYDKTGYMLLTEDDRVDDFYSSEPPVKKTKKGLRFVLVTLLVMALAGGGAYYYFTNIHHSAKETPVVTLETGSGVINGDEKVIYAVMEKNSKIEYIHGVSLYDYDITDKSLSKGERRDAVTTDYEYTKNIDATFRTVFFDAKELDLKKNQSYTYSFKIELSFYGSDERYTYIQAVTFDGDITENASDKVFDHSMNEASPSETETATETETTEETTASPQNNDYLYSGYWYTEPYKGDDSYTIFAIKFNQDKSYTSTQYQKEGSANWQVSSYKGTFEIEDGYLVVNNGEGTENTFYKIDSTAQTLTEEEEGATVQKLTNRKYNSVKNAEDFFGI